MSSNITINDVLEDLSEQGYDVASVNDEQLSALQKQEPRADSPWYLRLFVGFCAWLAALLFIGFLAATNIIFAGQNALLLGLVFCALGLAASHLYARENFVRVRDFVRQLGLAFSLAGQVLFVWGVMDWIYAENIHYSKHSAWTASALIGLEVILFALNRDPIQRFLSILITSFALTFLLLDQELLSLTYLHVFILAMSAIVLFRNEFCRFALFHEDLWQTMAYGVTVSLLALLLLPLIPYSEIEYVWVSAVLLLVALLFLEWQILRELGGVSLQMPWLWILLVCSVLLVIPATRMPGILGALIVLLLGFWRSKRTLLGFAGLFLIFYLGAFYYNLNWSLLAKSLALMASGILLFAARFLFKFFTAEASS